MINDIVHHMAELALMSPPPPVVHIMDETTGAEACVCQKLCVCVYVCVCVCGDLAGFACSIRVIVVG